MKRRHALQKRTKEYLEQEFRNYHESLKIIEDIRRDILHSSTGGDNEGDRGNRPGNPVQQKVILLESHLLLNELRRLTTAIQDVYDSLNEDEKKLIKVMYWTKPSIYNMDGIAAQVNISKSTAFRWRDKTLFDLARKLGMR